MAAAYAPTSVRPRWLHLDVTSARGLSFAFWNRCASTLVDCIGYSLRNQCLDPFVAELPLDELVILACPVVDYEAGC